MLVVWVQGCNIRQREVGKHSPSVSSFPTSSSSSQPFVSRRKDRIARVAYSSNIKATDSFHISSSGPWFGFQALHWRKGSGGIRRGDPMDLIA